MDQQTTVGLSFQTFQTIQRSLVARESILEPFQSFVLTAIVGWSRDSFLVVDS